MDERESLIPKFSLSEPQKARLIWLSEEEHIPVDHALDILLDFYQDLGDRDLDDVSNIVRLSKELKLRELSAQAVHRYLRLMQELAEQDQNFDHLDAAIQLLPALERAGLIPGSVPEAETIHLAARLTASGVTVTEVERWFSGRQRRRRPETPSDSGEAPSA